MHSYIVKHTLITPTKYTIYIHYIHLLYFSYMFRCLIHHHCGELLLLFIGTKYSHVDNYYGALVLSSLFLVFL